MSASLTIDWEPLDRLLADGLEDHLALHWEEVAVDKDLIPLSPDWPEMRTREKIGKFRSAGMRLDGKLIGYTAFVIGTSLHYSTTLFALNDVIYVAPEHRRGMNGVRLIRWPEKALKGLGVIKIMYHTKLHVHLGVKEGILSDLLERLGYRHDENMLSKVIGR